MSGSLPVYQPQQAPNPFAQAGQTINTINALRDYQGKQATADAYGQSIDPQTGAFDQGKFNALLAGTSQGRWNIGPSMQQSGQAQSAEGQGQQQQMEAARQQLSGISAYMQPLLQKTMNGQPVTGADVLSTMDQAPDSLVTPAMKANIQKQVAAIGGPTGDATNLVRGANFATMTAQEQLRTLYPSTQPVNLGSTVQPYQPSPLAPGGAGFTGRGVGAPTTLSPSANQPVSWTDINNVPQHTTLEEYQRAIAAGRAKAGSATPDSTQPRTPGSTAPPPPPPGTTLRGSTTGAYKPPGTPATAPTMPATPPAAGTTPPPPSADAVTQFQYPNGKIGGPPDAQGGVHYTDGNYGTPPPGRPVPIAPAAPATPPAPVAPSTAVAPAPGAPVSISGPNPQVVQAQAASTDQYNADRTLANSYQQRMWPMTQARAILQNDPDLTTGIGAEAVNRVKNGLETFGSVFSPTDMQTIRQANFDELGKYFQQVVNSNPFAGRSDQALAGAISGNPSAHLSTLANKQILDAMIGLERMKQAAFTDFQNSGQPPGNWADFKTQWQTSHDPRAFISDTLSDGQLKTMFARMSSSERAAYSNTIKLIKNNPSVMNTAPVPQ